MRTTDTNARILYGWAAGPTYCSDTTGSFTGTNDISSLAQSSHRAADEGVPRGLAGDLVGSKPIRSRRPINSHSCDIRRHPTPQYLQVGETDGVGAMEVDNCELLLD